MRGSVLICAPLVNRGSNALCVASATSKYRKGEMVENQFLILTNLLAVAMKVGAVLLLQQLCSHWSGVKITRVGWKGEIYAQAPMA